MKKSVGEHCFFPYCKGEKSVGVHCFAYYKGKKSVGLLYGEKECRGTQFSPLLQGKRL